jgi:DNA-binding MarR family transcriptional regulator
MGGMLVKTQGGFLMTQIKQVGGRVFEQILRDYGINDFNGAQGKILYVLWEYQELPISRIAKLTSLAQTTLTGMLDRMEEGGLVRRRHNPVNRREVLISITTEARHLQKDYEIVSDKTNDIYYKGFSEQEIKIHEQYLLRILANLKECEQQYRRKIK